MEAERREEEVRWEDTRGMGWGREWEDSNQGDRGERFNLILGNV